MLNKVLSKTLCMGNLTDKIIYLLMKKLLARCIKQNNT